MIWLNSRVSGLGILAVLALGLLVACNAPSQHKKVNLSEGTANIPSGVTANDKLPLRVAIAAVISPKETLKSYQDLLAYLGRHLARPVELVQRGTYAEVNDLIRAGNVDVAFVCTSAYLEGHREFGMELLVAPQVRGETVYYSYLLVPSDSPTQTTTDLRGKTFTFTDPMSLTGRQYPTYLLMQMGETPDAYFKKVVFTYSHDKAIKAVADRLVDGAAVDGLIFDSLAARDATVAARVRVIHKSPPFGIPPVVVHPDLDAALKQQLRALFLGMSNDKEGQAILRELDIEQFVVVPDSLYDPARQVEAYFRGRK